MQPVLTIRQPSFPELCPITAAVESLATNGGIEARGAIFTRREVVEFILDLAGYTVDRDLYDLRLLEPAFGGGDFLIPAIERLLSTWRTTSKPDDPVIALANCIRAVELHHQTFAETRQHIISLLVKNKISNSAAARLADAWLIHGDFLLADIPGKFDIVIGNPPYVRQEMIPDVLLVEYRARYSTIYDRADLYIPFIERSLLSLSDDGNLGFICADRWMKNRYGGPLRKLVAEQFHLKVYVNMVDTPAFHSNVIAYPAITIIGRSPPGTTHIAHQPKIERRALRTLTRELLTFNVSRRKDGVREITNVTCGDEPWIFDSTNHLSIVRRIESSFPLLEATGCKVGIGVATGADKAFIGPYEEMDVEDDRKIPLVMTRDIQDGIVNWRGLGVINPFSDGPGLVNLEEYPRLRRYLEARKEQIASRHCAQKVPANWYRTIDRITPAIAKKSKLLIPDIKGEAHIVFEEGHLYPHHNLYYITSDTWDLRALQAVLLSSVTRSFIATYSTKMRGGFLRFQAQYLRRLRLPLWENVSPQTRRALRQAAEKKDMAACNAAVAALYNLTVSDMTALSGRGD